MIKLRDILKEVGDKQLYYHVSPNAYKPGDVIKPYFNPNKYAEDVITDVHSRQIMKQVDDILTKAKSSKLSSRDKSIFVFKTKSDAKRYSMNMPGNRKIYEVAVNSNVEWHDINWIDYMFSKAVAWSLGTMPDYVLKQLQSYAKLYWNGESIVKHTSGYFKKSIWEGIVNTSVKIVS